MLYNLCAEEKDVKMFLNSAEKRAVHSDRKSWGQASNVSTNLSCFSVTKDASYLHTLFCDML